MGESPLAVRDRRAGRVPVHRTRIRPLDSFLPRPSAGVRHLKGPPTRCAESLAISDLSHPLPRSFWNV